MTPTDRTAADLARFVHPEQHTELRALHVGQKGRTFAGFFDGRHLRDMARHALALTRQAAAVYFVPNPVNPDLATTRLNTVLNVPRGFHLTHDEDVLERRFLIVDIDPRRFTEDDEQNLATTARELAFARRVADRYICPYLAGRGYAPPLVMISGNGVHLVYRYSSPIPVAGWGRSADPVAAALRDLANKFTCFGLSIDTNTFNPCRMLKVPGTVARKGDPTRQRPHRIARILEVPDGWREPTAPPGVAQPVERSEPNRKVGATHKPAATARPAEAATLFDRGDSGRAVH